MWKKLHFSALFESKVTFREDKIVQTIKIIKLIALTFELNILVHVTQEGIHFLYFVGKKF